MAIIWNSNFETTTYTVGNATGSDEWEYNGTSVNVRDTTHPSAAISSGRNGTGEAIWLGDYNNHATRSEISRDRIIRTDEETWVGFAMYVDKRVPSSRALSQMRNMKAPSDPATSTAAKNPFMLRQHSTSNKLYFNLLTDPAVAEVVPEPTGASQGARFWPNVAGPTVQGTDGSVAGNYGFEYNMNEWIDFVIYWSALNYTGSNILKIWVNGDLIVDWVGVTNRRYMPTGLEISGDLKHNIGPYWASTNAPQGSVYYDNYKVWGGSGGTYEDVHPTGASPNDGTGGAVTDITWLDNSQTVQVGDFLNLTYTLTPSNPTNSAANIVSSNLSVVNNGGVTISEGIATLTITASDTTNGVISDVMSVIVNGVAEEGSIIFDTNFETDQWSTDGDVPNDEWAHNGASPSRVGNARVGTWCVELDAADKASGDNRTELVAEDLWEWGKEVWTGFAFKIVEPLDDIRVFAQIVEGPSGTNPLTFRIYNSINNQFAIYSSTNPTYYDATPGSSQSWNSEITILNYTPNVWHDIVIYSKIDDPTGTIRVWLDDVLVLQKDNTTVHYRRDTTGSIKTGTYYPKLGPFWGAGTERGIIHFDAFKTWMGPNGTYEDVSPATSTIIGTIPIIVINGNSQITLRKGDTYTELGATWLDEDDEEEGYGEATVGGDTVDTDTIGTYIVTYDYTDLDDNDAVQVTRTVNVISNLLRPTNNLYIGGNDISRYYIGVNKSLLD